MKAKACTRCRQWKVRCDISEGQPEGCSRCRALNIRCVFDRSFKRTPKSKRMSTRTSGTTRPPPPLDNVTSTPSSTTSVQLLQSHELAPATSFPVDWASQLPSSPDEGRAVQPRVNIIPHRGGSSPVYSIGDVTLTLAQAREHFRRYFTWYHSYLAFKMRSQASEDVYAKSPLLFWAICAAASNWRLQSRLAAPLKAMVKETLFSPRSIETVQALLILCVWPCPFSSLSEDPSHFYSGLATQMSLQMGLHRPTQAYSHMRVSSDPLNSTAEIKLTTWLACFVVGQMQASTLGVPPGITVDLQLVRAFDDSTVDPSLAQLCRIYHQLHQASVSLSSSSQTSSGLLDPIVRLNTIKQYGEHFDSLREQHLTTMSNAVKIAFLNARVHLWSFALLGDLPSSPELLKIIEDAKDDACNVIDLCYHTNLSMAPYFVRRGMSYCAFVLVKLLRSPYKTQVEVLQDAIERVCQALTTTACSPDDINYKACQALRALPYLEDKKLTPPIVSRMEASVFYDLLRIWAENGYARSKAIAIDQESQICDFNGFDWTAFGILPIDMDDMSYEFAPCPPG